MINSFYFSFFLNCSLSLMLVVAGDCCMCLNDQLSGIIQRGVSGLCFSPSGSDVLDCGTSSGYGSPGTGDTPLSSPAPQVLSLPSHVQRALCDPVSCDDSENIAASLGPTVMYTEHNKKVFRKFELKKYFLEDEKIEKEQGVLHLRFHFYSAYPETEVLAVITFHSSRSADVPFPIENSALLYFTEFVDTMS